MEEITELIVKNYKVTLSTKEELLSALDKLRESSVLVVGDLMLDRYIWGDVERISQEAPVPVLEVMRDEERLGGAGNVIANLLALGVKVTVCGFVGDDEAGRALLSLLKMEGVNSDGVLVDRNKPTTVKTRVLAKKQQMIRIDRERRDLQDPALREAFATLIEAQVKQHRCVIISDYGKGSISEELFKRLDQLKAAGVTGLKQIPVIVDPHPRNYSLYRSITVAKPNRKEAEAGAGMQIPDQAAAIEAAKILQKRWSAEMLLVSLGADGLVIVGSHDSEAIVRDTQARSVFDVSGAGDTVTAVFSAALSAGVSPAVAGDLANIAAGLVIAEVGTVAVSLEALRAEISRG